MGAVPGRCGAPRTHTHVHILHWPVSELRGRRFSLVQDWVCIAWRRCGVPCIHTHTRTHTHTYTILTCIWTWSPRERRFSLVQVWGHGAWRKCGAPCRTSTGSCMSGNSPCWNRSDCQCYCSENRPMFTAGKRDLSISLFRVPCVFSGFG